MNSNQTEGEKPKQSNKVMGQPKQEKVSFPDQPDRAFRAGDST